MDFVEGFHKKVLSGKATLEDVRKYIESSGIAVAHMADGYNSSLYGFGEIVGMESAAKHLTNISVGGDLILINWLVNSAIEYAETARNGRNRKNANNLHAIAKNMIDLAECELQRIAPGTRDNLSEQRELVYEPLPDSGWLF